MCSRTVLSFKGGFTFQVQPPCIRRSAAFPSIARPCVTVRAGLTQDEELQVHLSYSLYLIPVTSLCMFHVLAALPTYGHRTYPAMHPTAQCRFNAAGAAVAISAVTALKVVCLQVYLQHSYCYSCTCRMCTYLGFVGRIGLVGRQSAHKACQPG